jgi:hypothetical protein
MDRWRIFRSRPQGRTHDPQRPWVAERIHDDGEDEPVHTGIGTCASQPAALELVWRDVDNLARWRALFERAKPVGARGNR